MRKMTFFVGIVLFATGFAGVLGWSWRERSLEISAQTPPLASAQTSALSRAQAQGATNAGDANSASDVSSATDANDTDDANPVEPRADAGPATARDASNASPSPPPAGSPATVSAERLARLSADATGQDPRARAAAIVALGSAPKADAAPVLEQVLSVADDSDRPLALRSLRALAQNQGDADDRIRSVVRKVLYHESDETLTQEAQATLEGIEHDLMDPATRAVNR
jgi:hypothetical protein